MHLFLMFEQIDEQIDQFKNMMMVHIVRTNQFDQHSMIKSRLVVDDAKSFFISPRVGFTCLGGVIEFHCKNYLTG